MEEQQVVPTLSPTLLSVAADNSGSKLMLGHEVSPKLKEFGGNVLKSYSFPPLRQCLHLPVIVCM